MPVSRRGLPIVVAAPSGTGKTTVCRAVVERDSDVQLSVSHTTRTPRTGERDGVDYWFVNPARFLELVDEDAFIEYAEYNGNNYGTSWAAIREPVEKGYAALLEIEVQGARQIRDRLEGARFIFLLPPDMEVLAERLRGRGTDDEDTIARRLAIANRELAAAELFDYAVVNADLEETIAAVLEIVRAERAEETDAVRSQYSRKDVLKAWRARVDSKK